MQHVLDDLVLDDGFPPLDAVAGVRQRFLVGPPGGTQDGGRRLDVAGLGQVFLEPEGVVDLPEDVALVDAAVLEDELGVLDEPLPHLVVDVPDGEPRVVLADDEAIVENFTYAKYPYQTCIRLSENLWSSMETICNEYQINESDYIRKSLSGSVKSDLPKTENNQNTKFMFV